MFLEPILWFMFFVRDKGKRYEGHVGHTIIVETRWPRESFMVCYFHLDSLGKLVGKFRGTKFTHNFWYGRYTAMYHNPLVTIILSCYYML